MALSRKYSGFNLYSAVPVPTQSSAVLVGQVGLEPTMSLTTDLQSAALPIPLTDPYLTYIMDYNISILICQVLFLENLLTPIMGTNLTISFWM